jgi:hypothetical protein
MRRSRVAELLLRPLVERRGHLLCPHAIGAHLHQHIRAAGSHCRRHQRKGDVGLQKRRGRAGSDAPISLPSRSNTGYPSLAMPRSTISRATSLRFGPPAACTPARASRPMNSPLSSLSQRRGRPRNVDRVGDFVAVERHPASRRSVLRAPSPQAESRTPRPPPAARSTPSPSSPRRRECRPRSRPRPCSRCAQSSHGARRPPRPR